jgi:hypothetical protein
MEINKTLFLVAETYEATTNPAEADVKQNTVELMDALQKQLPDSTIGYDDLYAFMVTLKFVQWNSNGNWFWLLKYKEPQKLLTEPE